MAKLRAIVRKASGLYLKVPMKRKFFFRKTMGKCVNMNT